MAGKILVIVSFILALGAMWAYFLSKEKDDKQALIGRYLFLLMFFLVVLISGILLANIIDHNFQYTYIWSYSSKELPLHLLISSFYAGQEGSFLLWALLLSIVGVILQFYSRKHGYESKTMAYFSLILVFLLFLLILKSPFDYLWQTFPNQNISMSSLPPNGRGLNPILESYWISIHPPILFTGYALMAVPFVLAMTGLWKKDYSEWVNLATPWALIGASVLGFGIMLGGFWAYETLGWGGFWGWDPVENSSLLPWLVSITLIHTLLIQKRTGGLVKTNFILAITSFILVLYATFLTRSGVLGETSVHSFVDPGKFVYLLLLIFLVAFALIGVIAFIMRFKNMTSTKISFQYNSREFFTTLGSIIMLATMIIVFFGTSLPIFQEILGKPKSAVDTSFYNNWTLPLAIIMLITNAFALYLNWRASSSIAEAIKKSLIALVIAAVMCVILIIAGLTRIDFILLMFGALYSVIINVIFIYKVGKKNLRFTGSYLSHLGLSLLLLGALCSSVFVTKQQINLKENQPVRALGYEITLIGREQIQKSMPDREKYKYELKLTNSGNISIVTPIIYWSDFNDRMSPYFEPGIKRYVTSDVYISPNSISYDYPYPSVTLSKGDSIPIPLDSSVQIKFLTFDISHMTQQEQDNPIMPMGAIIKLNYSGKVVEDTLFSEMNMNTGEFKPIMKQLDGKNYKIGFSKFDINQTDISRSKAEFSFIPNDIHQTEPTEIVSFEISKKPIINLVWLGVIFIIGGLLLSVKKQKTEKKD